MTEIQTIDGGQKDALLKMAKKKKILNKKTGSVTVFVPVFPNPH